MKMLHNSPVKIGDKVFDIIRGNGIVVSADSKIVVNFNGYQASFDSFGFSNALGRNTLFWHDPVIIAPTKNIDVWGKQVAALKAVYEVLK